MLPGYALCFFLLVAFASCASQFTWSVLEKIADSAVNEGCRSPENAMLAELITKALADPLLQGALPSVCTSVLRFVATEVDSEHPLFNCLVQNYLSASSPSAEPRFWQDLVDTSFRQFAQADKEQAHVIIEYYFILQHPFSAEIKKLFTIESFLKDPTQSLSSFFQSIICKSFNTKFSSLITRKDAPQNSQRRLSILLHKYQQTHPHKNKELKYVCAFLTNLGAEQIARSVDLLPKGRVFYHDLSVFSLSLYQEMQSTEMVWPAQSALRKVLPSVYDSLDENSRTYDDVISVYVASGQEPFSQEVFRELLTKSAQNSRLVRQLPSEYVSILNSVGQNLEKSHVCDALFDHFHWCWDPQNPHPPSDDPGYWQSVIDQSLNRLAQASPQKAQEIIDQVILLDHPFSDQIKVRVDICDFLDPPNQPLWRIFGSIIEEACREEWSQISMGETFQKVRKFHSLLSRFKQTFCFHDPSLKYVCAFLMNIPFEWIESQGFFTDTLMRIISMCMGRRDAFTVLSKDVTFHSHLKAFSREIYRRMEEEHPGEAQEIFSNLLRQPYEATRDKSYEILIEACVKSGIEPANPAEIRLLISKALRHSSLVRSRVSPVISSLLSAFVGDAEYSHIFFDYFCESDPFREIKFETDKPYFWEFVINRAFLGFSLDIDHRQWAQELIQSVMMSSYPLFQTLNSKDPFSVGLIFGELFTDLESAENIDLESLVEKAAQKAFHYTFCLISKRVDAAQQFILLLHNYSLAMFPHPVGHKYSYAFLMHLGIEQFQLAVGDDDPLYNGFFHNPHKFSAYLYKKMTSKSALPGQPQKARMALKKVLPETYKKHCGKSYKSTISAYVASELEPRDLAHLKKASLEALNDLRVCQELLGEHAPLLEGSSAESQTFLCYIFQNYQLYKVVSEDQHLFWISLVFSSTHKLAQTIPQLAQEIFNESIVAFNPFSRDTHQEQLIFSESLLDFSNALKPLTWATFWGHTHSAAFILKRYPSIGVKYAGMALTWAAEEGHLEIAALFIDRKSEISIKNPGEALRLAAQNGHLEIAALIIDADLAISMHHIGKALVISAQKGHFEITALIFNRQPNIPIEDAGWVLKLAALDYEKEVFEAVLDRFGEKINVFDAVQTIYGAVSRGDKDIITTLLKVPFKISAGYYREALISAAEKSHPAIFELLIQWHGATVTTNYAGQILLWVALNDESVLSKPGIDWYNSVTSLADCLRALSNPTFNGYATLATLLLKRLGSDPASDEPVWRIVHAARAGKGRKVAALMNKPKNVDPTIVGWALVAAAHKGYFGIVNLFLKRFSTVIRSDDAGTALRWAASKNHSGVCKSIIQILGHVISSSDAREALWLASDRSNVATVNIIINHYGSKISAHDFELALLYASRNGCTKIVTLISERSV